MIVVASNDNESPQVTLPGFSICVRVPVCYTAVFSVVTLLPSIPVPAIRRLTRFLTMAEVAETAKTAWSSLTVWQFFMKRVKEASIIATRVSLDVGFREFKNALQS